MKDLRWRKMKNCEEVNLFALAPRIPPPLHPPPQREQYSEKCMKREMRLRKGFVLLLSLLLLILSFLSLFFFNNFFFLIFRVLAGSSSSSFLSLSLICQFFIFCSNLLKSRARDVWMTRNACMKVGKESVYCARLGVHVDSW